MRLLWSDCEHCNCDSGRYGCSSDYPGGAETFEHTFVIPAGTPDGAFQEWRTGPVKSRDYWLFTVEITPGEGDQNLNPLIEIDDGYITSFGSLDVYYGNNVPLFSGTRTGPADSVSCGNFESPRQFAPEIVIKATKFGAGEFANSATVRIIGTLVRNPP